MRRVLIANRGEIACRVIRACRTLGLETVAVFSEADAAAEHVALADDAMPIGPAAPRESYLVAGTILAAAASSRADAIHPGYGFLSENAGFARAVLGAGLIWIGPAPETIEAMGDKERAREIARAAGVPILPGSRRFAPGDTAGMRQSAEAVGYPLLVKAAAGGGGIGMRRVDAPEALEDVAAATQSMAARSFGDGTIYLERFIPVARHVEIQVFGFGNGEAVHLFERDCSLQRRFQKLVEESPAPGLPRAVRDRMAELAVQLCREQRYAGAGTIEFIVDAASFEFFFLEMNTRIQVEHPVTEMVTGIDLVSWQLRLAAGMLGPVDQTTIRSQGHAIECRICAEDPGRNFLPSPGHLDVFRLPVQSDGLRIDTGVREGDTITPYYDSMVAKLIARADTRERAIERMVTALTSTEIVGLKTNVAFLASLIRSHGVESGELSTGYVERERKNLLAPSPARAAS